jgi:hypothetical protein
MLSARLWKARRVPWHAFAFWVWMSVFLFGTTFNDLFHSPNCPERIRLSQAVHGSHQNLSGTHAEHRAADSDCVACVAEDAAQAVLPSVHFHVVQLAVRTFVCPIPPIHARESVTSATSRGPPPALA